MANLRVEQYVVGAVMTNCYFAVNTDTKEMFFVDPGDMAHHLIDKVIEHGYQPVGVVLTHGHFDHAGGVEELVDAYKIPVYAGIHEKETLENPAYNLSGMAGGSDSYHADHYLNDSEQFELAGFMIRCIETPGHTAGGCCYYLEKEQCLFSGDTLFSESVGRTDFPGGSMATLARSIREKLFVLPAVTEVYPGHNEATTIGWEKEHNPFL